MFNKKQNDAWCTSTKTNDHCSKDLVDHQGMFMTKASKNAPVVDVLHAVELEAREHLLGKTKMWWILYKKKPAACNENISNW